MIVIYAGTGLLQILPACGYNGLQDIALTEIHVNDMLRYNPPNPEHGRFYWSSYPGASVRNGTIIIKQLRDLGVVSLNAVTLPCLDPD